VQPLNNFPLRAIRPLPPRPQEDSWYSFLLELSRLQGYSATGRIRLIEECNDFIGTRTRDLPASSIVRQPTTLPRSPTCEPKREIRREWREFYNEKPYKFLTSKNNISVNKWIVENGGM
jgi:hypothetical protein